MTEIDRYYLKKDEPEKSFLLALRHIILNYDEQISEKLSYGLPMFHYKKKMFCYIWRNKKTHQPYIGMSRGSSISHPALISGGRKQVKIIELNLEEDIPVNVIKEIFDLAMMCY